MKTILQIFAMMIVLAGCAASESTRGNFLHQDDVAAIQPEISTKNDVLNLLGTPTTRAVFDDSTWYYVGLKTEKKGFFDEKVVERKIYKLTFDDLEMVQSIQEVSEDAIDVPLAARKTPTSGKELSFLQQMLGNIGKFNPPAE